MSIYYFLHPSIAVYLQIRDLSSPQSGISKFAFNNHRAISDEIATWAQRRVDRSLGKDLSTSKISGTEWPMFSVVYFLWSTEELDKARIELGSTDTPRPKDCAANAKGRGHHLHADMG